MSKKCSYDVCFAPIVNVMMKDIVDPKHPTEEEKKAIIKTAAQKLLEESHEKLSGENLESITLYEEDVREGPLFSPVPIFRFRTLYVATIIERNESGDTFASILHAFTPKALFGEVIKYLLTEENERGIDMNFNEDELLNDLTVGNEQSGLFRIECENADTEFLVSSTIIEL